MLLLLYLTAVHMGVEYIGIGGLGTMIVASPYSGHHEAEAHMPIARFLVYIQLFLPAIFLIIAFFSELPHRTARFARIAKYLALASAIVTILDIAPILLISGPSIYVYMMILVSSFCLQVLVVSISRQLAKAADIPLNITPIGSIACASILFTILFSVVSAAAVVVQATEIADGQPYCIAMADEDKKIQAGSSGGYGTIRSWEVLRGSRFSTTSTGFKIGSRWYYHAVLIVERESGEREYWNWSIGKLSFHKIRNALLKTASPANGCQMSDRFLSKLPLI